MIKNLITKIKMLFAGIYPDNTDILFDDNFTQRIRNYDTITRSMTTTTATIGNGGNPLMTGNSGTSLGPVYSAWNVWYNQAVQPMKTNTVEPEFYLVLSSKEALFSTEEEIIQFIESKALVNVAYGQYDYSYGGGAEPSEPTSYSTFLIPFKEFLKAQRPDMYEKYKLLIEG